MSWHQVTVGEACVATLQVDPARSGKQSFRYVDISGVDRDAKVISRADEISSGDAPSRARKVIAASDILVSTVRPNLNAVAFVPKELDGEIASTGFAVLRANRKLLDPKFLYYWVQNSQFVDFLVANATGASYPAVSDGIVKRAPLLLPPQREQNRIVELLDQANELRRLRCIADAKAARILPALFLKMFGDPARNPMGWDVKPLGELADQKPEYGANASAVEMAEGKPRFVRITDIREDGSLSESGVVSLDANDWHKYLLQEGDVLFARSGNTVGKTYIYRSADGSCAFAGYLIRFQFRSGDIDPWFVFGMTKTGYYKNWVNSHKRVAGQPNINGQEYSSLPVPVPPSDIQKEFGRYARLVEEKILQAAEAGGRLDSIYSTLLQKAFSGELTAKWRQAHIAELLAEMQLQAKALNLPLVGTAT